MILPRIDTFDSMWEVLQNLKRSLPSDLYLVSLVMCWKIWEDMNLEVHGYARGFPSDLVAWLSACLDLYSNAQGPTHGSQLPASSTDWTPPKEGTIKINVDVALPENADCFWTSLVARNSSGDCVWWRRQIFSGRPSPTGGGALAVLHEVQEAKARGWPKVIVETDCYPIYWYLINGHHSLFSFGAVIDSFLSLALVFKCCLFPLLGVRVITSPTH